MSIQRIGTCQKCGTEFVEVYLYKSNYWICSVNECWTEETERDSGRHIRLNRELEEHRKIIERTGAV